MIQRTEYGYTGSITDLPAWGTNPQMGFVAAMVAVNTMKTHQFEIAGVMFRLPDFKRAKVDRGDRLTLVAEPQNQHDAHAIKLLKGDIHIGYVPRSHNQIMHKDVTQRPEHVGCCVDAAWASGAWVVVRIREESDGNNGTSEQSAPARAPDHPG